MENDNQPLDKFVYLPAELLPLARRLDEASTALKAGFTQERFDTAVRLGEEFREAAAAYCETHGHQPLLKASATTKTNLCRVCLASFHLPPKQTSR